MITSIITGGTGFIGSNLCVYLLSKGHKVICIDNNFTGSMENIKDVIDNDMFTFIIHDVVEPFTILDKYIDTDNKNNKFYLYHLACPASPPAYQKDPIKTLQTGFIGTMNALEYAVKINAKFLFTSTSEIYGDPTISPQTETYWGNVNTLGPRSCYDESKRIGETLVMEYKNKYNLDTKIARLFNTYGPRMDPNDGRVVSNFINQCIRSQDITVYGEGKQTRSLCYITDTVNGLYQLINSSEFGPFNIGNPHEQTIIEIADKIKILTNSKSNVVFKELPQDDPMQRCPDISKITSILQWTPQVSFEAGMKLTIEYYTSIMKKI
jgi:UDP-glucuronate decarboxylase